MVVHVILHVHCDVNTPVFVNTYKSSFLPFRGTVVLVSLQFIYLIEDSLTHAIDILADVHICEAKELYSKGFDVFLTLFIVFLGTCNIV